MSNRKLTLTQRRYERGCDYYNDAIETKDRVLKQKFLREAEKYMRFILSDNNANAYSKASAYEVRGKIANERKSYAYAIRLFQYAMQKYETGSEHYCRCKVAIGMAFINKGNPQQATLHFDSAIRMLKKNDMEDSDLYKQAIGLY